MICFGFIFLGTSAFSQTIVKGITKPYTNIQIEELKIVTTADENGNYEIILNQTGQFNLIASLNGYQPNRKTIEIYNPKNEL